MVPFQKKRESGEYGVMPHSDKPIIGILGSDSLSWIDVFRYVSPDWCGEIVGGGENCVDHCVQEWCAKHKIEYISFAPNYKIWGRRYGHERRNDDVASYVDNLIYFWDSQDSEVIQLVQKCNQLEVPYRIHVVEER